MKKVEASRCYMSVCSETSRTCGVGCVCFPTDPWETTFECQPASYKDLVKIPGKNPNFCQSHVECKEKGSGSFCARYPSPNVDYGLCVASLSEGEDFFKIASKLTVPEDFLTMFEIA